MIDYPACFRRIAAYCESIGEFGAADFWTHKAIEAELGLPY